ncbi:MAG: hypothetical protein HON76_08500 [Candidatus Scalindua sp.]|nr:hypothetical protein [Candidatus Scalindua sp.]
MFQCLRVNQVAKLFCMNLKVCQRRLRKLHSSGYLQKRLVPSTMPGASPLLYYLGEHGASLLGVPILRPRLTRHFTHMQQCTDIMLDVFLKFQEAVDLKFRLLTEHIIRTSNLHNGVIPDGSFCLQKGDKSALYLLENCSGTEIIRSPTYNEDIESKIIRYADMFKNNSIQYFSNYFESTFKRFRLLYITNNEKRLESIGKIASEHDTNGFILLTTLPKLKIHGVDASIWFVPATGEIDQRIV